MKYLLIWLMFCASLHAQVIERVGQPHIKLTTTTLQPPAGGVIVQSETGVQIRRISDVVEAQAATNLTSSLVGYNDKPASGLTNGYARWSGVNQTGEYVIAFGTTPLGCLYRTSDFKFLSVIQSKFTSTGKVGDQQEIKWSRLPEEPYIIYYMGYSGNYYKQDIRYGISSETRAFNWGSAYEHTSDGDFSADGVWGGMLTIAGGKVGNVKDNFVLPGWTAYRGEVDVSPDARFVKIGINLFKFDDFKTTQVVPLYGTAGSGHGGWAIDWQGNPCYVQQDSRTDYVISTRPDSLVRTNLMRMVEIGGGSYNVGLHVASDKKGVYKGWALLSEYGRNGPFAHEIFFLEVNPVKPPSRIVRLCSMQTKYVSGQYFTEAFASVGDDGCIYWGGNWHASDNLELYRAELPASIKNYLKVASVVTPTPTPVPTATPTPVPTPDESTVRIEAPIAALQRTFASKDNFATMTMYAKTAMTLMAYVGGRAGGEYDQSMIIYAPIDVPEDFELTSATLDLAITYDAGGYIANGKEGIPIRAILDPENKGMWQICYLDETTTKPHMVGASYAFHTQTGTVFDLSGNVRYNSGQRWSSLPSTGLFPTTGDLFSVLDPITSDTVRFNLPTAPNRHVLINVTPLVSKWLNGLPNRGFYIDPTNMLNPASSASNVRTVKAGVRPQSYSVAADRPKFILAGKVKGMTPVPTPTPVPTATPSPIPTPWVIKLESGQKITIESK